MRILKLFWGTGEGGDATAMIELLRVMKEHGVEFTLVAYAFQHPTIFEQKCERVDVPVRFVSEPGLLWQETRLNPDDFDIVHCHHGRAIPKRTDIVPLRKVANGKPLLISCHGPDPLWSITWGGVRSRISRYFAAIWFKYVIVPSKTKLKEWHDHSPFTRNVMAIPYVVRFFVRQDRAAARDRWQIPADAEVVLFCSRFAEEKDPETFIRAVAKLHETRPKLVGVMAGMGELLDPCRELVEELEAPVLFVGFVTELDLLHSAADVFVQTSLAESFCITLIQAAEFGLPCAATTIPIFREMYEGQPSIRWLEPMDADGCAAAIENCFGEVTEGDCGVTGDSIRHAYSAERVLEMHQELWRKALGK